MSVPLGSRVLELSIEGLAALGTGNACDLEPIHLCGAVQPYGFLLAVDSARQDVVAASANAAERLGLAPDGVLGRALGDVLGSDAADALLAMAPTANPHEALSLRVCIPTRPNALIVIATEGPAGAVILPTAGAGEQPAARTTSTYDVVWHTRDGVLILEFEPSDEAQTDAYYLQQRNATKRLSSIDDVETICQVAAQEVRSLTGYDRVMVYRFDADAHGCVIAEARTEESPPFLGLHYPAGDIPRQARALYLRNWIRVIGDAQYEPVPILAVADRLPGGQLDLGMAVLRSVSAVHLQYLRNMGVRATMTISLIVDNQLWGMVACHHEVPKQLSHLERLACEGLGQLVSVRIRAAQALEEHTRATGLGRLAAEVVTAMAAGENPAAGAAAAPGPLLAMVGADAAVVQVDGHRCVVGPVPDPDTLELVVAKLCGLAGGGPHPFATDALPELFRGPPVTPPREGGSGPTGPPDLDALAAVASGALMLALPGHNAGFVLWLRAEKARTVRWAGRPEAKPADADGSADAVRLSPRASFAEWREQVRNRSTPWSGAELAAATELAQAMPEVFLHRSQNRLFRFALHDPLTGLPNRLLLRDRLDSLLRPPPGQDRRRPNADAQLAVLFLDLDGFKAVNDSLGHACGDELLTLAAQRLASAIRPQDMVARMSGDEFVVLALDVDEAEATSMGQRLVEVCRRPFLLAGDQSPSVTTSIGLTMTPTGTEPGEALRQADTALYHAKRAGRNQLAVYDPATGTAASRHQLDSAELAAAIVGGQLVVHYQPIVDLQGPGGPTLDGFEALVRWQHPSRGLVAPDQFVRLAEQAGLIDELGDLVLSTALRQLQAWPDGGLTMAVNISVRQLVRPGFTEEVLARLVERGIAPGRLCLEITESQMMEQPELALTVLGELAACGLRLAIDDFGTGFSSLAYVRNLPAALLKIDRSFTAGLPSEPKDVAVIAATIRLAHELGMRTVAEGVETQEQLVALHGLGADFAQGFLLGRPVPPNEVSLEVSALTRCLDERAPTTVTP